MLKFNGITILTGNNGSGKSLIRKQLPFKIQKFFKKDNIEDIKGYIKSISMDTRTASRPEFGALSTSLHDVDWLNTSMQTVTLIDSLLDNITKSDNTQYVVLDEIEIGLSEETMLALVLHLNKKLKKLITNKYIIGVLIITHSRIVVKNLESDYFINMENLSKDEWLNRKIIPTNLKELKENKLFDYIRQKNKSK